jgi:hypothetical protein
MGAERWVATIAGSADTACAMSKGPVSLDRQFVRWSGDREIDVDLARYFDDLGHNLDWEALLARRRVVILAEAGSGKSTELREQARLLREDGRASFVTTLQRIGQKGSLEAALGAAEWRRFREWETSGDPCWLFLDSVDEAKRADFALFDILTDVGDAIEGMAGRVHVILSGRVSDWEFRRDLGTLLERIPIPPPDKPPPEMTPDEELIAALRNERSKSPPPAEEPLVVAMAALDRRQVEVFAREKGVTDTGTMFGALEGQNLWSLARRPTDLDWLVDFWVANRKFGSLQEMLDVSIDERLKETNPARARKDGLDGAKARSAIERVGAALVLQRLDVIVVPDTDREFRKDVACLDLKDIVPDLSPADQDALITRPVFDPATPGFLRLHNDNQAEVRGFLAAKWLLRLRREGNLTVSQLFQLLFAEPYGVKLVIPSMRATAAWLALWDAAVSQEVVSRDPRLLMDAGDPASLGLDVRVGALDAMMAVAARDEHFEIPNQDALRRFAQEDLAPYVRDRWAAQRGSPGVRTLLLLLIHLGAIRACADIAAEATQAGHTDRYTPIFAGRALLSTGDPAQLRAYLDRLVAEADSVHPSLIWDALEALYPGTATTEDLLELLAKVKRPGDDGGLGLDYYGPRLAALVPDADAARLLVETLLDRLKVRVDLFHETSDPDDERHLETLEVAAARYASLLGPNELPASVVDAGVRIGESRRARHRKRRDRKGEDLDLDAQVNASPARRRIALWRCAELFRSTKEQHLTNPWQLRFIGFAPRLELADATWLMEDMGSRESGEDVRLATNGALQVWLDGGSDPGLLERIRAVSGSAEVQRTIESWLAPPVRNDEFARQEAEHRRHVDRDAIEDARKDQTWIDFRSELVADPRILLDFGPPDGGNVDGRLYHLWHLLSRLGDNQSHYAIADISPLRRLFGDAVTEVFREAMIAYWRLLDTRLPIDVPPEERRTSRANDLMGIVGVTLEAGSRTGWARGLSDDQARLAARFATRELNGFPKWLDDLALAHPAVVAETLWRYVAVDLLPTNEPEYRSHLEDVATAGDAVAAVMAPLMVDWLEANEDVEFGVLDKALGLVGRVPAELARAMPFISRRSLEQRDRHVRSAYIGAAYVADVEVATELLMRAFEGLSDRDQVLLAQTTLPRAFGSRFGRGDLTASGVPFATLERLVLLAFEKVRPDEDVRHPSLEVYSPGERDHAEDARGALFNALVNTPGYATYAAIQRFRTIPDFPVWDRRLRELAHERASADSEPTAMRTEDVLTFERDGVLVPATSADLQRVGVARLDDIGHALLHGDYNQGMTVARLPNEVDVQNWFADALASRQTRSFSLEREPHVAEEKEPDIRLSSLRDPGARCPIEIKVAGSWSLRQLEDALTVQLRGRYLRDRVNRFGILLVVHNTVRKLGWRCGEEYISFAAVMVHLSGLAREMASSDALAPQVVTVGIDLSRLAVKVVAEAAKCRSAPDSTPTEGLDPPRPRKPASFRCQSASTNARLRQS